MKLFVKTNCCYYNKIKYIFYIIIEETAKRFGTNLIKKVIVVVTYETILSIKNFLL